MLAFGKQNITMLTVFVFLNVNMYS